MSFKKALFFLMSILVLSSPVRTQNLNYHGKLSDFEVGITLSPGVYKSYVSSFIYLRKKDSTPIFNPDRELPIYRWLFSRIFRPKYLVLQATAYPLAWISSQLETFHPRQFNRFEYMGMNLLRSVGAGPEEPYALSLLLGNFAFLGFRDQSQKIRQSGSMLAGFLLSAGHWHIQDNIRLDDRWLQTELILTGQLKESKRRDLNWNFRIGLKMHRNDLAPDVIVLSLYRSHTEWHDRGFSLLRNSRFQYEASFPIGEHWRNYPFTVRQLMSYSKKFPFQIGNKLIAFRIGGGVLWEYVRLFDRESKVFEKKNSPQIVYLIQPGVEF